MPAPPDVVGPYKIERELGRGGMGVVYLAHDPRLDRAVAIKALPDDLISDPARLARFEREARLLASLSHPNIAGVYGLEEQAGARYLIMEFVEGEDLSARIARGPMPLDEALPAAIQIAAALEAAHDKGVIHRDLKPANIKLTPDGRVKVLDFGLAKPAGEPLTTPSQFAQSPTAAIPSMPGMLLGTAGYLSPEQARGRPVDKRTDIFSFGCVLFEMFTGITPFRGETVADAIGAALHREPDWSTLPAGTPPPIRGLLERCLAKDARERLRDIGDARLELEHTGSGPVPIVSAAPQRSASTWTITFAAALLAAIAGAISGSFLITRAPHAPTGPTQATHLSLTLPDDPDRGQLSATLSLNITPDGRRIVYVASDAGGLRLFQRHLDEPDPTVIADARIAGALFLSPDSRWVAYESAGHIVKSALSGGAPIPICTTDDQTRGGCWLDDGTMVVSRSIEGGLWRVSESGGDPALIVEPDRAAGELSLRWPEALPASRGILFVVKTSRLDSFDDADIWALDLKSKSRTKLITGGCAPRFIPDTPSSGLIIYSHHNHLWAARLDLATLTLSGIPLEVWPDVPLAPDYGLAGFAIARDSGTLVYIRSDHGISNTEPVWVDPATGAATPLGVPPGIYADATVGPDGQVALGVLAANNYIALVDDRGVLRRLTHGYNVDSPAWTPSGDAILAPDEHGRIMRIPIADPDKIAPMKGLDNFRTITSWSPDGKLILCTRDTEQTGRDIWLVHADGSAPPEPLLATPDTEDEAIFSPDGKHIAYTLTQNGHSQIMLRPFPAPGPIQQVSLTGGTHPLWSADGSTLYFRNDNALLAAAIPSDPSAHPGTPRALFTGKYLPTRTFYARAATSNKLLLVRPTTTPPDHLDVVLNWTADLKHRLAAARP